MALLQKPQANTMVPHFSYHSLLFHNVAPVEPTLDQLQLRSLEQVQDGMEQDILLCGSNVIVDGI